MAVCKRNRGKQSLSETPLVRFIRNDDVDVAERIDKAVETSESLFSLGSSQHDIAKHAAG